MSRTPKIASEMYGNQMPRSDKELVQFNQLCKLNIK